MRSFTNIWALLILFVGIIPYAAGQDLDKGKAAFEKCAACHSLAADNNDDAPTLYSVYDRKAGSVEQFRYSAAMKRSDVIWTERTLDAFLEDPQAFIPGNRMAFDGVKDKSERADLLAYLRAAVHKPQ